VNAIQTVQKMVDLLDVVAQTVVTPEYGEAAAAGRALLAQLQAGETARPEPKWIVNDQGELGVMVAGRAFFLYKGRNIEYGVDGIGESKNGVALHEDGTPMMYRMVGKREFGETCQPVQQFRDRWPGGQGAKYLEPLVYTPGLSFGHPEDGAWKPLPAAPTAAKNGLTLPEGDGNA
jgi:hypothetical protein